MEVDDELPSIVCLNVGGTYFTTSLETLQGSFFGDNASSMLASMFSGRIPAKRDGNGNFFIDRDGRHFHHILNYLRDGKFPAALAPAERCELLREASFYNLEALTAHLRADLPLGIAADGSGSGVNDSSGQAINAVEAADR